MATIIGPSLPDPYESRIESVWRDLESAFGIDRPRNPHPHFTLYGLDDDVDVDAVETAIVDAATDHSPFSVHTDGVGVFPGNHVWLPVARSPELTALHADVVQAVEHLGTAPTPFYEPHRWFPHIAFALALDDDRTTDVVEHLLDYDFEWDFTVDSITITRPPSETADYEALATIDL